MVVVTTAVAVIGAAVIIPAEPLMSPITGPGLPEEAVTAITEQEGMRITCLQDQVQGEKMPPVRAQVTPLVAAGQPEEIQITVTASLQDLQTLKAQDPQEQKAQDLPGQKAPVRQGNLIPLLLTHLLHQGVVVTEDRHVAEALQAEAQVAVVADQQEAVAGSTGKTYR